MSAFGKGRRRKGLTAEDRALWDRVAATATPLAGSSSGAAQASALDEDVRESPSDMSAKRGGERRQDDRTDAARGPGGPVLRPVGKPGGPVITTRPARSALDSLDPGAGLDRRTAARLKRGKRNPEARLDLHGMTAGQAHAALGGFLRRARAEGKRCVLVITGKGGRKPAEDAPYMPERTGVLRYAVPEWLTTAPLSPLVVGVYSAHQTHGGHGALYVYLRKAR